MSLQKIFHLLLLPMFQLVQFKLLTVLNLVKLVLNIQMNVSVVILTELFHQLVTVSMDSIKMKIYNVKIVISDVSLVMLSLLKKTEIVLLVLILELLLHLVVAQLDTMITINKLNVNNVIIDVQPVT